MLNGSGRNRAGPNGAAEDTTEKRDLDGGSAERYIQFGLAL